MSAAGMRGLRKLLAGMTTRWQRLPAWLRVQSGFRLAGALLALLVLLLAHRPGGSPPLEPVEHLLYDLRLQLAPHRAHGAVARPPEVVVLDIDERALAAHGRWPWPRRQLAQLLDATADAGARLIGLDLVLAEPDISSGMAALDQLAAGPLAVDAGFQAAWQALRPQIDDDARLAAVLARRPVVLGFHLSNEPGAADVGALPAPLLPLALLADHGHNLRPWTHHGGVVPVLLQAAGAGAGHLNAEIDADGTVRRMPLLVQHQGGIHPSLALAMLRTLLGAPAGTGPLPVPARPASLALEPADGPLRALVLRGPGGTLRVPVDAQARALVPFAPQAAAPGAASVVSHSTGPSATPARVSAADLLAGRLPPQALQGRLVVVGVSAPGLIDQRRTPVDAAMFGTLVHAQMLTGLVQAVVPPAAGDDRSSSPSAGGPPLPAVPPLAGAADVLWLLAAGALLLGALPRLGTWRGALLAGALMAAAVALNLLAWWQAGWVLPLAGALLLPPLLLALQLACRYRDAHRARRALAERFGQYVPPELVDALHEQPDRHAMTSRSAELTVLFADVSGFTAVAAHMPPQELGALMNLLFSHLTDVVRAHRGTLDKYIGDAVMAFWGAPLDDPDHARHAVDAAQAMLDRLPAIHAELAARGWPPLRLNIGINTGTMVVGDMGSRHRRAYTVLGDAVNVAARLQDFSSRNGLGLVVGDATRAALHNAGDGRGWLPLGTLALRGRDAALPAWQPLPALDGPQADALVAAWQDLQRLVRSGRPLEALAQIDALEAAHPGHALVAALCRWQRMRVHQDLGPGHSEHSL